MKYKCRKCNSEFELEKDADDIYCPYCGYLAKSEERNTFYRTVKVIKPIISKKDFVISQLEKMSRLEETPKDVFDNLDYNVKELFLFYAVRKAEFNSSYEATVEFKEKETFTSTHEYVSRDKDGNKVTITKPFEDTRTVTKKKIVNDVVSFDDSFIINFKGASEKDLEIISNYKNSFEIDNDVEIPMKNIRSFLKFKEENEKLFDERCEEKLESIAKGKIIDKHNNYDYCAKIELKGKEV